MCIYEYTDDQLRDFYENGRLIFVNPNVINNQPGSNQNYLQFTQAQLEQAKIRRAYVVAILNSPNTKSKLIPVIQNIWSALGKPEVAPSPVTVINWKNKFVKSGNDYVSLTDRQNITGNRKKYYPDEVTKIVQKAIDTVYLTLEMGTIQNTFNYAYVLTQKENELRPTEFQLPFPTRRLVMRMIEAIPVYDQVAARHGLSMAAIKYRSAQAHISINIPPAFESQSSVQLKNSFLPHDMVQIDAILGHSENRVLTRKGIELYGLFYDSPDLIALRMQIGCKSYVEIRVNETNLGHIIVLSLDNTRALNVPALDFDYANGLSILEHRVRCNSGKLRTGFGSVHE